jgi:hypothetical protein
MPLGLSRKPPEITCAFFPHVASAAERALRLTGTAAEATSLTPVPLAFRSQVAKLVTVPGVFALELLRASTCHSLVEIRRE